MSVSSSLLKRLGESEEFDGGYVSTWLEDDDSITIHLNTYAQQGSKKNLNYTSYSHDFAQKLVTELNKFKDDVSAELLGPKDVSIKRLTTPFKKTSLLNITEFFTRRGFSKPSGVTNSMSKEGKAFDGLNPTQLAHKIIGIA